MSNMCILNYADTSIQKATMIKQSDVFLSGSCLNSLLPSQGRARLKLACSACW